MGAGAGVGVEVGVEVAPAASEAPGALHPAVVLQRHLPLVLVAETIPGCLDGSGLPRTSP